MNNILDNNSEPLTFADTEEDPDRVDEGDTDYGEGEQRWLKCPDRPMDCEELLACGYNLSGIYRIYPRSRLNTWGEAGFDVFCDMDTDGGGWTVIHSVICPAFEICLEKILNTVESH
ncbi:hypothetical protein AVEN_69781-1 [Araneus ventricosus]|uniref:Fibrinogen C-terminal domain-containing protein n=1 Tax=Araneus ventricosus TaxID=182803 RepID=A0A4Y2CXA9_ARAVE|nr:hypothetical protein AVEN_69781-1 [Araneus ventricosus]